MLCASLPQNRKAIQILHLYSYKYSYILPTTGNFAQRGLKRCCMDVPFEGSARSLAMLSHVTASSDRTTATDSRQVARKEQAADTVPVVLPVVLLMVPFTILRDGV
jgi:hypothetical protein